MIGFDIGHHCDHWLQVQKRGITLISLGDQNSTGAELRITANTIDQTTNHKSGIQARLCENGCNQTGGCRLTMRARHCNTVSIPHQFCQHLCPWHHRNSRGSGGNNLWVFLIDRTGTNDHISTGNIVSRMANENFDALSDQPLSNRAGAQIRACDLITQIHQHLGDTTHARATDTDHMYTTNAAHLWQAVNAGVIRHTSAPHSSC